ncbi:MAG: transcriptional regulator, partial [Solirubrobacteraceae bacterium]
MSCYSKIWPCLFPQHGPGKKHERPIVLAEWQQELIDRCPEQLVHGLIHSDGCRFQNTGRCNWSWPRYAFAQTSDDIRDIFCRACDRLGLRWTAAKTTIY